MPKLHWFVLLWTYGTTSYTILNNSVYLSLIVHFDDVKFAKFSVRTYKRTHTHTHTVD